MIPSCSCSQRHRKSKVVVQERKIIVESTFIIRINSSTMPILVFFIVCILPKKNVDRVSYGVDKGKNKEFQLQPNHLMYLSAQKRIWAAPPYSSIFLTVFSGSIFSCLKKKHNSRKRQATIFRKWSFPSLPFSLLFVILLCFCASKKWVLRMECFLLFHAAFIWMIHVCFLFCFAILALPSPLLWTASKIKEKQFFCHETVAFVFFFLKVQVVVD